MTSLAIARTHGFSVLMGAALLFVSAQIQIPLQPVPITLQTVGVMILGLLFDKRSAIQAVLLYLGLGVLGLPVFAGFSNIALVGARAGYLVGFLGAVWAMTTLREYQGDLQNIFGLLGLNLLGSAIIYACGIAWLAVSFGLNQAILIGFVPFIIPGLVKILLLSGIVRFLRS